MMNELETALVKRSAFEVQYRQSVPVSQIASYKPGAAVPAVFGPRKDRAFCLYEEAHCFFPGAFISMNVNHERPF